MIEISLEMDKFIDIKEKHYVYFYENSGQVLEDLIELYRSMRYCVKAKQPLIEKEEEFLAKLIENKKDILNKIIIGSPYELNEVIKVLHPLLTGIKDINMTTQIHFDKRSKLRADELRTKISEYENILDTDFKDLSFYTDIKKKLLDKKSREKMNKGIKAVFGLIKQRNVRNYKKEAFYEYKGATNESNLIKLFNKGFFTILTYIFSYEKFKETYGFKHKNLKGKRWGAYELAADLDIQVCPYCNRQYITVYEGKDSGRTRCEFDHFFPKSKYPYLAISLCNLIPSCKVCNSDLKGVKDFRYENYLNPYEAGYENYFKFQINEDNLTVEKLLASYNDLEITIKENMLIPNDSRDIKRKAKGNLEAFKIQELYNFHKEYVIEVIKKKVLYDEDMIEDIYKRHDLFESEDELYRILLGGYKSMKDYNKRPFSKLIRDISEEIKLF